MWRAVAFRHRGAVGARRRAVLLALPSLLALAMLCVDAEPAQAHGVAIGQSKIRQDGNVVHYELAVNYDQLAKRVSLADTGASGSPPPELTDTQRQTALHEHKEDLAAYIGSHVRVFVDSAACTSTLETVEVLRHRRELFAVIALGYHCPATSGAYTVHYDLFFDSKSATESVSQVNVADYELGGAAGRIVFEPGNQRLNAGGPGILASAGRFIVLGFQHILGGIDHVLFILVLLLGARTLTGVIRVATAFTAAHSVTLALAAIGWVSLPPSIVEPLIAASIAYVAVENIIRGETRHRLLVVFAFGLMHGLGFADALNLTGETTWRLISSLLAFNIGIEVGQAVIIVAVWPLLLLARRQRWQRLAQVATSGVIACLGSLWVLERLFLT